MCSEFSALRVTIFPSPHQGSPHLTLLTWRAGVCGPGAAAALRCGAYMSCGSSHAGGSWAWRRLAAPPRSGNRYCRHLRRMHFKTTHWLETLKHKHQRNPVPLKKKKQAKTTILINTQSSVWVQHTYFSVAIDFTFVSHLHLPLRW